MVLLVWVNILVKSIHICTTFLMLDKLLWPLAINKDMKTTLKRFDYLLVTSFWLQTLREEAFADRNFRGFEVFNPFPERLCPWNFSKLVISESSCPQNLENGHTQSNNKKVLRISCFFFFCFVLKWHRDKGIAWYVCNCYFLNTSLSSDEFMKKEKRYIRENVLHNSQKYEKT